MKKAILLTAISAVLLTATQTTLAASQAECAIWICLPGGFPSGCGDAHSAMKKRLRKGKSPLPSFSSCLVSSDSTQNTAAATSDSSPSEMTYRMGTAVWVPGRRVCETSNYGDRIGSCSYVEGHWDKTYCRSSSDEICSYFNTRRYIDVYIDGKQTGATYYW